MRFNKKEYIIPCLSWSLTTPQCITELRALRYSIGRSWFKELEQIKKGKPWFSNDGSWGDWSYIYLIIFFLQAVRGESGASSLALPSSFPSPLLSPALSFILKQYTFKKYIRIFYYANFVVIFRERLEEILHKKCYLSDCLLKCCWKKIRKKFILMRQIWYI